MKNDRRPRTPGFAPADHRIRDAADVVDLTRLTPSWDEAQIGPDVWGSANARGIVDCRHKRERGQLDDLWPIAGKENRAQLFRIAWSAFRQSYDVKIEHRH